MELVPVRELAPDGGDLVAWSDSDTGPTMAARTVGVRELAGTGLTGRYRIVCRLKDESIRTYNADGDELVLVFERAFVLEPDQPAAKPKAAKPAAPA